MSLLIWTLLIAVLLPFLSKLPVAIAMHKLNGYDNNYPRSQQEKLTGFGARALAAHKNSFESLIIFAPAILTAITTHNTGELIQQLAVSYIIARVLYHILYLLDFSTLRTLVWIVSLLSPIYIIWLCIP